MERRLEEKNAFQTIKNENLYKFMNNGMILTTSTIGHKKRLKATKLSKKQITEIALKINITTHYLSITVFDKFFRTS